MKKFKQYCEEFILKQKEDEPTGKLNGNRIRIVDFKDPDYPVDITIKKDFKELGSMQFTKNETKQIIKELQKIIKKY